MQNDQYEEEDDDGNQQHEDAHYSQYNDSNNQIDLNAQNYQFNNQQQQDSNNVPSQKLFEDQITEELEDKVKVLDEFAKGKPPEQLLSIRMHQLALAKVLVFTHGKPHFNLVKAHTNIAEAYLNYKCHEQALDHLAISKKKNLKLFSEDPDSKPFQSVILTLLGRCHLEIASYDDSLDLLKQAYDSQLMIYGDNSEMSIQTLTLIANCQMQVIFIAHIGQRKMKDYEIALEIMSKVYAISEAKYGHKSEQTALTYIETAKIHACLEDWENAINLQNQAIGTLIDINYDKPEYVADLYSTMASYLEKDKKIGAQVNALQKVFYLQNDWKVKKIFCEIHGPQDKKVIKIKRQISIILLKNEQHQQALKELYETEELEMKVYGETSVQVAKTQKIIGTVLILTQEFRDAQTYLQKSLKIYQENGMKKNIQEVKQKIKMVKEMKDKDKQPPTQVANKEKQNLYKDY